MYLNISGNYHYLLNLLDIPTYINFDHDACNKVFIIQNRQLGVSSCIHYKKIKFSYESFLITAFCGASLILRTYALIIYHDYLTSN